MAASSFQFRLNGEVVEVSGVGTNESLLSWLRRTFETYHRGQIHGDSRPTGLTLWPEL